MRGRPARYAMLGELIRREGNFTESESSFRKAVEGDPTNLSHRNSLASVLLQQGKVHEAKALYLTIVEEDSCYKLALVNLKMIAHHLQDQNLADTMEKHLKRCH
jgi:Flp pilus assembly protein TadD